MAVANPAIRSSRMNGKEMEERMRCWVKADVSNNGVEEEGEGSDRKKEENVNEKENEAGGNGEEEEQQETQEEMEIREAKEVDEEKAETNSEMGLKMEKGNEEEDRESTEVNERVDVEEEEKEVENECEVNESDKEDEAKENKVTKAEEGEEEEMEREVNEEVEEQIQNSTAKRQEDEKLKEEDSIADSVDSIMDEDSDFIESEDEHFDELRDSDENIHRNENVISETQTTLKRNEEVESEMLTEEEETTTQSWATEEDHGSLQDEEEASTDDEETEHSVDEDGDCSDEDDITIYFKDDYSTDVFLTLNEFRCSSILTDLTLRTEDGTNFCVHAPVLAAASSLIWDNLTRNKVELNRADERKDGNTCVGVHRWLMSLGPEVDDVGLEAILEFAYTGQMPSLNKDNVDKIKAAAQILGAPRVLDLCTKEEEKSTKTGGQKKRESISPAQQLMISLQSIKQLWMDRVGCDVILEASGGSLHVHRVILAVGSDYFRGMFTSGMKESHQPCVSLPFLLASELEVLIGCSYSGTLPMSWRCIFEITSTALQLQYQPALYLCFNFLCREMNLESCLDVASFAEAYEMAQLLEVAEDFVLRHFQMVACTSKFKDLSAKQLLKYLNSKSLCVPSELVVFKAVVTWIQAKPKIRLRLAQELMKTVHFPLMTFKEFKEVRSQTIWSNPKLAALYEKIFEDFCSNETAHQNQCRIYLPKESLVLTGGEQITEDLGSRNISRELWFGNSLRNHIGIRKAMEWRRLGEMPGLARFGHEVAVLKGQLYVFGGKKYYGIGDTLNCVYRYDPCENSWECLAEMQEKRCFFSVVVLDEKIYAIGGHCEADPIHSVERYCPSTNSWSFTSPLDLPLSEHVAKVTQGQIFISGGRNNDYLCLASMFLYHPEMGSTYLANMTKPRAHHCMETLGEYLYVAGGITTHDDMTIVDQLACEVYSPVADCWTAFASLPVPHVGAGSAVLEGKFYVLGGYSQEDYSDTKMVHRYDPATQKWENLGKMPGPNNDIRASLLCLPKHFRM